MPLPEGFSDWEHLQTVIMQVQNRFVREEFSDVGDEDWDPDIVTPRASLRVACTLKDSDSAQMTLIRLWLFYGMLHKASDFQAPVYGLPTTAFQSERKFKPQIELYFHEDIQDVDADYDPVAGEIRFRIMSEEFNTISKSEATTFANRIKTAFASGNGFVWKKGKLMVAYSDWNKGYQLQLLCRDVAEGKRVIEQVLDIQQHTPDWSKMTYNQNEEPSQAYPTLPPTEIILGKSQRMPRRRPIADVRFKYAMLHLHGRPKPLCLVDRTGRFRDALVEA